VVNLPYFLFRPFCFRSCRGGIIA